jgi:hypothetical protein
MAQQTFKQPGRRRDDEDPFADDQGWSPNNGSGSSSNVSRNAGNTLGNIDNVLADQEASASKTPGGGSNPGNTASTGSLKNSEEVAGKEDESPDRSTFSAADKINERLGKGYTGKGSNQSKMLSKLYSSDSGLKKKIAIAGAAAGGSLIGGVLVFVAFLPLKIEHLVSNLESHFGATSENAVNKETQNLYSSYMQKYVLPSLNKPGCASTAVSKDCVSLTGCGQTNPVCHLFQAWHQTRLEKQMSDKYGIEFGRSSLGRIYMKAPGLTTTEKGLPDDSVDITDFADGTSKEKNIFSYPTISRTAARQAMNNALEGATLWDKILFRFKYGKLIELKYGIKRCVIACTIRDKFADSVANKKQALALYTIEHVVQPRSAALAYAIQCLMDPNCTPDAKSNSDGAPAADDPTNGEIPTEGESEVQGALDQAAVSIGSGTLDKLAGEVNKLNEAGNFSNYMVQKVLEAMGVSEFTKEAVSKAIPIVGWINTAAEMVGNLAGLGKKVVILAATIKAAEMAQYFAMYETSAAEMKSGNTDLTETGSIASGLSNGTDMSSSNEYQNVVNGANLPPNVPAKYSLNGATSLQSAVESASGVVPGPVAGIANLWNSTLGAALGGVSGLACNIPLISNVCSGFAGLIGGAFKPIITWLANELFPSVVQPIMQGGSAILSIIGGADVAFNSFAHSGLGGMILSPLQVAQIQNEQIAQEKQSFDALPMYARIFDTDSSYSLVSRVAMDMPTNLLTATNNSVASILDNPVAKFGSVFSDIFSPGSVFAASTPQADPYDVTQYGYPANDPVFSTDPETEWNNLGCSDTSTNGPTAKWNNNTVQNTGTGQYENTTTDPCLLLEASIQSAGGLSDPTLLPPGSQNN